MIIDPWAIGFFAITVSNIFLVSTYFKSFGSGNTGDTKCEDFHCKAVKWLRINIYLNALWVGGNLFHSLWGVENTCHLNTLSHILVFVSCKVVKRNLLDFSQFPHLTLYQNFQKLSDCFMVKQCTCPNNSVLKNRKIFQSGLI